MTLDPFIDTAQEDLRGLHFLTVKVSLFDVVKHSSVTEATEELAACESKNLRLTVRDGGQGFDTPKMGANHGTGAGFGLDSLSERLLRWGGTLGVEATLLAPMKSCQSSPTR